MASARWALIGCAVGAFVLRWPAYGMPLDRDASVYAVVGRGLGWGDLPYRDLIDHKQPVIYPVYGLIDALAPGGAVAPRMVSALVCVAAALLVYALVRSFWAPLIVVVVGASRFVQGFDLNTEHLLLVTGTAPIAVAFLRPRQAVLAGVLCGLAILTKAVAVLLVPAVLIALGWRAWPRVAAGIAIPLAVLAALYLLFGAFADLWTWNVSYNREYASALGLGDRISHLKGNWPSLLLIACATVALLIVKARERWLFGAWLAGAVLGALLGGYGYAHYFVPVIAPAAALLALAWFERRWAIALIGIALAPFGGDLARSLAQGSDRLAARTYGANVAIWEATEPVGELIHARADPGDRMYVAGSEAGFYQQARVRPASRLLYDSILALRPEEIPDLCASPPRFLVLPHGQMPAYASCLNGYRPLPGVPAPVVVMER